MPEAVDALIFKTEEEQAQAMAEAQAKIANGERVPDEEIDKIANAKIEGQPDPEPVSEPEPEPTAEPEPTPEPEPKEEPEPKPAPTEPESFTITKEMIPDDTFMDRNLGRERKIWSFTKPEDIVKTLIQGQKHIHRLEGRVDEAKEFGEKTGYEKAKAEYEAKIAELEKKPVSQPTSKPEPQAAPAKVDPVALKTKMDNLKTFDPKADDYDAYAHNQALQDTLETTINHFEGQIGDFNKFRDDSKKTAEEQAEANRLAAEKKKKDDEVKAAQEQAAASWNKACEDMDRFVGENKIQVDQGFNDMTREAEMFHVKLARMFYDKPFAPLTRKEIDSAAASYRRQTPALLQKMTDEGIGEPRNYKVWEELDQIDAVRTGLLIDPETKEWRQRTDVRFPDLVAARDWLEGNNGKALDRARKEKIEAARKVTNAINKRDKGVVEMDPSRTAGGHVEGMTEEQAIETISKYNAPGKMDEIIHNALLGDKAQLEDYNKAMITLGDEPIDITQYGG